jgi:hypothetical protein
MIGASATRPFVKGLSFSGTHAGDPKFVATDEGYLSFYAGHVSTGVAAVTAAGHLHHAGVAAVTGCSLRRRADRAAVAARAPGPQ